MSIFSKTTIMLLCIGIVRGQSFGQISDTLKLKDFRPVSIYQIPHHNIQKAKFPVIDFHSHDYPKSDLEVDEWVKTMDSTGVAKSIILSYSTGAKFDSIVNKYRRYPTRFEIWCGFDYSGFDKPGWITHALTELERCHQKGAKGVGELGDKGLGEYYSFPFKRSGMHIDDPRMRPLLERCAALHMPVSIHVAEDAWMYLAADSTNDGLLNGATWKVDMTKPGILGHDELIQTLENAVKNNPKTTFIACHLANSCADLNKLAKMFDVYPNLYADIAARYAEISPIPKFARAFLEKYSDRIVYGTDMGTGREMYRTTFRILETEDEHFYDFTLFTYHWPLYGLGLTEATLQKIYSTNGLALKER